MSATFVVNGTDISAYFIASHRKSGVCSPGETLTVELSPACPTTITPGMTATFSENGVQVIGGAYVYQVIKARPNAPFIEVGIGDSYSTRVTPYFIDELITTGAVALHADYWAANILDRTGITYSIAEHGLTVSPGLELGLRNANESLHDVLASSSWYARVDANGVLNLGPLVGELDTSITVTDVLSVDKTKSDEMTRTTVKIFGGSDPFTNVKIFAKAEVHIPGISDGLIAAAGMPGVEDTGTAQQIANYLIGELGSITKIVRFTCPGNPNIRVGLPVAVTSEALNVTGVVTSLGSSISAENGYIMDVTLGERCPRIGGWSRATPLLAAGLSGGGVYTSSDGGSSWGAYNDGLPATSYVRSLALSPNQELMAIVNGSLYYRGSDPWVARTLPTPTNSAGDSPAPGYGSLMVVDSMGVPGDFAVMAVNSVNSGVLGQVTRTWIYTTEDAGLNWTSTEVESSGSGFHFSGLDMSSRFGSPTVVGTSGSDYDFIHQGSLDAVERVRDNPIFAMLCQDPVYHVTNWDVQDISVSGTSPTRTLSVTFRCYFADRPSAIVNQLLVHSPYSTGYTILTDGDWHTWLSNSRNEVVSIGAGATQADIVLTYPEATVGTLFSAKLAFERRTTHASTPKESQAITGETADCFTVISPVSYGHSEAGWLSYDFDG